MFSLQFAEDNSPRLVGDEGNFLRNGDFTRYGIGMGESGNVVLPQGVTAESINDPTAMMRLWETQRPSRWTSLAGNTFGGKVGGTSGLVAPGWMPSDLSPGTVISPEQLFYDAKGSVEGVDLSSVRKQGFTDAEMAARSAFLSANPGWAQLTASHLNPDGTFRTAGPSAGNFIIDPSKVKFDPTYGYMTETGNFGYAGGKGGFRDALTPLAMMALMATGAHFLGPGAGAADAGWVSGFDLPMGAAGAGGASGAGAAVGMGELGSGTFGLSEMAAGASAGTPAFTSGVSAGAAAPGFNVANYISTGVLPSGVANLVPTLPGGGGMEEMLKKLLSQAGLGNSPLSTIFNVGSSLYGLKKAGDLEDLAMMAANRQDPFGPYRGQYAQRLQDLYANPTSVANLPGYKAGLDAVERKMAASGYLGSGNMALALQDYGGRMFDAEAARLAQLAGSQFGPSGQNVLLQGGTASFDALSKVLASLGYGAKQIEDLIRGL